MASSSRVRFTFLRIRRRDRPEITGSTLSACAEAILPRHPAPRMPSALETMGWRLDHRPHSFPEIGRAVGRPEPVERDGLMSGIDHRLSRSGQDPLACWQRLAPPYLILPNRIERPGVRQGVGPDGLMSGVHYRLGRSSNGLNAVMANLRRRSGPSSKRAPSALAMAQAICSTMLVAGDGVRSNSRPPISAACGHTTTSSHC
jgi:hypothetical protein